MKHSFLLAFFAVFYMNTAFPQAYIPFIGGDKMWTEDITSSINPYLHYVHIYTFGIDTTMNSIQYRKIIDQTNTYLNTYIREDTLEKKVYCKKEPNSCEILLYDFDLQVGDTFYNESDDTNCFSYDSYMLTTSVTYEFFAGKNRKKMILNYFGAEVIWYEGIGCMNKALFNSFDLVGGDFNLLCYFEDSILLYHNNNLGSSCFVNTEQKNANSIGLFRCYYYYGVLFINTEVRTKYSISIRDIVGNEIKTYKNFLSNSEILINDLLPGAYIISINCDYNNYFESNKIIIY